MRRSLEYVLSLSKGVRALDPDTAAYLARMDTQPSAWEKWTYDYFIRQAKTLGLWSKIVDCAFPGGHEKSLAIKPVKGTLTPAFVGSGGTFIAGNGLIGDGATAINTGYKIPAGKQNACAMGCLIFVYGGETAANSVIMGNPNAAFTPKNGTTSSDTASVRMTAATGVATYTPINTNGMWTAIRTASNAMSLYRDEEEVISATTASVTPDATYTIWVLGRNQASPTYSTRGIAFWYIAEDFTKADAAALATLVQTVCGLLSATTTVLTNPSPETRGLLSYMAEMNRRREYFVGGLYTTTWFDDDPDLIADIVTITGQSPALLTVEWVDPASGDTAAVATQIAAIKAHYAAGGMISLCHHSGNPVTGQLSTIVTAANASATGGVYDTTGSPVLNCLTGGTAKVAFDAYVDRLTAWLAALTDSNGRPIPVMVRFFHEIDGGWFWWSSGTNGQISQLWTDFVNRLNANGVTNALFDFNCNINNSTLPTGPAFGSYPGNSKVDIISGDFYDNDSSVTGLIESSAPFLTTAARWKPRWYAEIGYELRANVDTTIWSVKTGNTIKNDHSFMSGLALWRFPFGPTTAQPNTSDFQSMASSAFSIMRPDLPPIYTRARQIAG